MPLSLFRSRNFAGANAFTLLFFLPLNLIQGHGYSATAAGAAIAPAILVVSLLSRYTGASRTATARGCSLSSAPPSALASAFSAALLVEDKKPEEDARGAGVEEEVVLRALPRVPGGGHLPAGRRSPEGYPGADPGAPLRRALHLQRSPEARRPLAHRAEAEVAGEVAPRVEADAVV